MTVGSDSKLADPDDLMRLFLTMAPSFLGRHSETGAKIAMLLGIPFPLRMEDLALAARVRGFTPDELWPWWGRIAKTLQALRGKSPGFWALTKIAAAVGGLLYLIHLIRGVSP